MEIAYCEVMEHQPVLFLVIRFEDGQYHEFSFGEGDLIDYADSKMEE